MHPVFKLSASAYSARCEIQYAPLDWWLICLSRGLAHSVRSSHGLKRHIYITKLATCCHTRVLRYSHSKGCLRIITSQNRDLYWVVCSNLNPAQTTSSSLKAPSAYQAQTARTTGLHKSKFTRQRHERWRSTSNQTEHEYTAPQAFLHIHLL